MNNAFEVISFVETFVDQNNLSPAAILTLCSKLKELEEYLEGNNSTSGQTGTQPTSPQDTPQLLPGEVVKFSGKYPQLTKIPGKNFFKDEVIIRNSDSGKVNP